jgi:hypothetical protein
MADVSTRNRWLGTHAVPLGAFLLSGIVMNGYFTWDADQFNAACSDSGNSLPNWGLVNWMLSIALWMVPGIAPLLARSIAYSRYCLVVWGLFFALEMLVVSDAAGGWDVNCYKRIGIGEAILWLLAILVVALVLSGALVLVVVATANKLLQHVRVRQRSPRT